MADEQTETEQRIRELAYQIWIQEGRPDNCDAEHWSRARAMIEGDASPASRDAAQPEESPRHE